MNYSLNCRRLLFAVALLLALLCMLCLPRTAQAATHTASSFGELQTLINTTASAGDTIEITGDFAITSPLSVGKSLKITSGSGGPYKLTAAIGGTMFSVSTAGVTLELENIVLDGANSARLAQVTVNGGALVLNGGATLQNGYIGTGTAHGGGVNLTNGGSLTMKSGSSISGCEVLSTRNGGGVYVNGGSLTMENGSSISGCKAGSGGGVYIISSSLAMNGSITGCEATGNNGGGVYSASSGVLSIDGGSITGCTAISNGPGIFANASFKAKGDCQLQGVYLSGSAMMDFEGSLGSAARISIAGMGARSGATPPDSGIVAQNAAPQDLRCVDDGTNAAVPIWRVGSKDYTTCYNSGSSAIVLYGKTLTPCTAQYDLYVPGDLVFEEIETPSGPMTGTAAWDAISLDGNSLAQGSDYSISAGRITLHPAALAGLSVGEHSLTVKAAGIDYHYAVKIEVSNSAPPPAPTGPSTPSIPYNPVGVDPSQPTDSLGNPTGLGPNGTTPNGGANGTYGDPANMQSEAKTSRRVIVYDEPTGEERIDALDKGHPVIIRGIQPQRDSGGNWANVEYRKSGEDRTGLIDLRYLAGEFALPLKGTVIAKKSARLYTDESKPKALRLWYKRGANVKVTGLTGGYYLIDVRGKAYRMRAADVELIVAT